MKDATTPSQTVLDTGDRRIAALKRLEISRSKLQAVLMPRYRASADTDGAGDGGPQWSANARKAWRFMQSRNFAGLAQTVSGVVGRWWHAQPWQPAVSLLGQTANAEIAPWIRKRPVTAVALGVAVGVAITWMRPWQWSLFQRPTRSLRRSAGHWMLQELSSPAMQLFFATSLAAWMEQRNAPSSAAAPEERVSQTPVTPAPSKGR